MQRKPLKSRFPVKKMDISGVSFCVESKRKMNLNPFSKLSAVHQSHIPVPHEFQGVHLNGHKMEEHCYTNLCEMNDIKYTNNFAEHIHGFGYSRNVVKNEQLTARKEMCGNYNHFSAISFSKLVGGFVGSKSQVGCANREPCQIWDIILRQIAETACHTTNVQKSAHQCYDFGKTLSQNILDSICQESKSALYYFQRNCGFFDEPEMSKVKFNNTHSPVQLPSLKEELALARASSAVTESSPVPLTRDESFISLVQKEIKSNSSTSSNSQKQSYAEVAKSFLSSKSDISNSPQHFTYKATNKCPNRNPSKMDLYKEYREPLCRYKSVDRSNWREKAEPINNSEPLYSTTDQNYQFGSSSTIHPTIKKQRQGINTDRPGNDSSEHVWKRYKSQFHYNRTKISRPNRKAESSAEFRNEIACTNERYRPVCRNAESRVHEMEEGNSDFNVDNESVCNSNTKSGKACKNWRCKHNRIACMDSSDFRRKVSRVNNTSLPKISSESVPPITTSDKENTLNMVKSAGDCTGIDSCRNGMQSTLCPQEHSQSEDGLCSQSLLRELSSSTESSSMMSLLSTSSYSTLSEGSGLRRRISSECSVDSEDSFVVMFEPDCTGESTSRDCDSRVLFQCTYLDSDTSDSWSDCDDSDTDESDGEDQVDFCYVPPLLSSSGQRPPRDDLPLSSKLQDINATWSKEYSTLPSAEKTPEKIHFASSAELTTVHPMVAWDFAYRAARCGPWEEIARDRARFQDRVDRLEPILAPILTSEHRAKVWGERMNNSAIT